MAQVVAEAQSVSEVLNVPLYRAGDKIPVDQQLRNFLDKEDDQHWDSHGYRPGGGMSLSVSGPEVS